MKREGYTLVEVMAAMLILGLALTGLFQGARLIGGVQRRGSESLAPGRLHQAAEQNLAAFLGRVRPGRARTLADVLNGNSESLSFPCIDGVCRAWLTREGDHPNLILMADNRRVVLPLESLGQPSLVYLADDKLRTDWPPKAPEDARLDAIAILNQTDGTTSPLVMVTLWSRQAPDCEFDVISSRCRLPSP